MKTRRIGKTVVMAAHPGGPAINGGGGCFTRWKTGRCSGEETARWLNSLGDDSEPYTQIRAADGHTITNGEVRLNWLTMAEGHVKPANYLRRDLLDREQRLLRELEKVRAELFAIPAEALP